MRSQNNGDPSVCVNNLLQIARGEVPYDRVKGIGTEHFDVPSNQAIEDIAEDAEWMLGTYEPRADIASVDVTPVDAVRGHYTLTANLNTTKEGEE